MTPPKKYKWYWSLGNLWNGTQPEVVKLQHYWIAAVGFVSGTTYVTTNPHYTIAIMAAGGLINFLIGCIYIEELQ